MMPRSHKRMQEVARVKAVWDDKVGHTRIKKLKIPDGVVDTPKGGSHFGTTGLYCRAYNKDLREHQFHLLLYSKDQLKEYEDGGTMHLRGLNKFTNDYGWKLSFCLGFAIDEDGLVKRNSCSNVQVTGQRTMPDEWYDQLVNILQRMNLKVKADNNDDDLSALFAKTKI